MNIKLLKMRMEGLSLYEDKTLEINLMTTSRVPSEDVDTHVVEHLSGSFYKQNVLAFSGINASGKTTTLKIFSFILDTFIENNSLEHVKNEEILSQFEDECSITTYYYWQMKLYELTSRIAKNDLGHFYFVDEWLKIKPFKENIAKKKLLDFDETPPSLTRKSEEKAAMGYLRQDTSIFMKILYEARMSDNERYVFDMTDYTNVNILTNRSEIPVGFIQYLDSSIESLEFINSNDVSKYSNLILRVKFSGQDPQDISVMDLWKYLSSGTIKGINLLMQIEHVLHSGGYIIIDEIENHLNKTIVITLINLFKSKMNRHHATLIFSTHYSEILDDMERNDSIYFTRKKNGKIQVFPLSNHLSRSDKKKSAVYLSGLLGTAPKYNDYMNLKKSINQSLQDKTRVTEMNSSKRNDHV
ncbi:AAA family ATPase [Chryseomicrobium palamuruense]|uniref:AAA family ATPase n=1 Tax=Chryseomicrobium palamuruense TaxID=682973 RepID=A0ABV8UUX7_9BACL